MTNNWLYGLMAEFGSAHELVRATERTRQAGYREFDAYAPFPVEGLPEALGFTWTGVPLITLIGGLIGCSGGFFLQWWPNVIGYPLNIGGKPWNSWPMFIPITFELTILFAALFCVFGLLALNGFPAPYHPLFNVSRFARRASSDLFFLCIEASDPQFDLERTRAFLAELNPREVSEVPE